MQSFVVPRETSIQHLALGPAVHSAETRAPTTAACTALHCCTALHAVP
ncbi:hypothetical protein ACFPRL_16410 [Pseudoclavibacter helvolus]